MHTIAIANEQRFLRISRAKLLDVAQGTLRDERVADADISIALVNDRRIREVHRDFMGLDSPTDVISFLLDERKSLRQKGPRARSSKSRRRGTGKSISGEIVLSVETAIRTAREFHWPPRNEVLLYLVHGLLHLCGYDDLTPLELKIMRRREREVLGLWGIVPEHVSHE